MRGLILAIVGTCLSWPYAAVADPWKDESGHGRAPRHAPTVVIVPVYPAPSVAHHPPVYAAPAAVIPPGHLPPPGECRVWYPDRPAGHQPPPQRC